jgi:DNA modification methylase
VAKSISKNRVIQGDCVKLIREVEAGSVDLVFADPPFNIGYEYDVYDDAKQSADYLAWCRQWIEGAYHALKPTGTFWLAIGDEYAAELKLESQKVGFHCRSWVIWYYTFGVNCVNGFSRSHTHLFHFVKDKKSFTFDRPNPQIRVKSARQLVYADNRANPDGRLPDNTWIIRPQDAPQSFSPNHDTWYFARVAGTFKEREGFHGCQMPEQLLARIIRASSRPQDLVLDPFGGSGTTMCVAKKLGRQWIGFELSKEYAKYINERLAKTNVGDPIDGPEDPIESAPSTAKGKRRKPALSETAEQAIVAAFQQASRGYPVDYLLCHDELDEDFVAECRKRGLDGSAFIWNRCLLDLMNRRKLPKSTNQPPRISPEQLHRYDFASEVAWRLLSIDYQKTLDDILCSPEFAKEFDRLAKMFGPPDVASIDYRRAALTIRKRTKPARDSAAKKLSVWMQKKLRPISMDDFRDPKYEIAGAFVLRQDDVSIYAGESGNIRKHVEMLLDNPNWQGLEPNSIVCAEMDGDYAEMCARKSALVQQELPALNCRLWISASELPT